MSSQEMQAPPSQDVTSPRTVSKTLRSKLQRENFSVVLAYNDKTPNGHRLKLLLASEDTSPQRFRTINEIVSDTVPEGWKKEIAPTNEKGANYEVIVRMPV